MSKAANASGRNHRALSSSSRPGASQAAPDDADRARDRPGHQPTVPARPGSSITTASRLVSGVAPAKPNTGWLGLGADGLRFDLHREPSRGGEGKRQTGCFPRAAVSASLSTSTFRVLTLLGAGDTTAEPERLDVNGQRLVQVRDIELGDKQGCVRHAGVLHANGGAATIRPHVSTQPRWKADIVPARRARRAASVPRRFPFLRLDRAILGKATW